MPPRWNAQKPLASMETIMAELPYRFRHVEINAYDGSMIGLRDYMTDLTEYLLTEFDWCPVTEVMAELGIPPSEWYRHMMEHG